MFPLALVRGGESAGCRLNPAIAEGRLHELDVLPHQRDRYAELKRASDEAEAATRAVSNRAMRRHPVAPSIKAGPLALARWALMFTASILAAQTAPGREVIRVSIPEGPYDMGERFKRRGVERHKAVLRHTKARAG
jgi:hypothetical protein